MLEKQTPCLTASKIFVEGVRGFFKAAKDLVLRITRAISSWYDRNVRPLIKFIRKYERDVARHKHNQYTRSTWNVQWDLRQRHQVTNRKPQFAVARRNC